MPMHHYSGRSTLFSASDEIPEIFRLWLLRLLVPLGAHRTFLQAHGFESNALARALNLDHWIDDEEDLWSASPLQQEEFFARDSDGERLADGYDPKRVRSELQRMHRDAERDSSGRPLPEILHRNLIRLSAFFELTEVDVRILEFTVMLNNDTLLDATADWLGQLSTSQLIHVLSVVLARPENQVRTALSAQGVLARTGLVTCLPHGADTLTGKLNLLSDSLADQLLSGDLDPVDLLRDCVAPCPPPQLTLDDYAHLDSSLALLLPYLRQALGRNRKGVNILLHGLSGTGKTQLARVLALELGCDLFQVTCVDENGDAASAEQRLRAFQSAQNRLAHRRMLLAFDVADDVLTGDNRGLGHTSVAQTCQAWIHHTLEENPVPTLWLSGDIARTAPSFIRRFDMVIELPIPARQQRQRILTKVIGDLLDDAAVTRIAKAEKLAPAVATKAASVVRAIQGHLGAQTPGQAVESLIDAALAAQKYPAIVLEAPARQPPSDW